MITHTDVPSNTIPRGLAPTGYVATVEPVFVSIRLTDQMPMTSWMKAGPNEYGFYANVNPQVDHPRWSQKTERRLGELLKRPTLMFNGYEEVASLYSGMDLVRNY